MAVELLRGEPYDKSVDFWALGVIVYEMMIGAPPFEGDTPHEVEDKTISVVFQLLC